MDSSIEKKLIEISVLIDELEIKDNRLKEKMGEIMKGLDKKDVSNYVSQDRDMNRDKFYFC